MGGEGSMMAANNSLKNNRNLVSKRKEKRSLHLKQAIIFLIIMIVLIAILII